MQTTIYHYTGYSRAWVITEPNSSRNGLIPKGLFGEPAIFALLEPEPEGWARNPHFPQIWNRFISKVGLFEMSKVLLQVDVDTTQDEVFVAERAHMEGFAERSREDIPDEFHHESREKAELAFSASTIKLEEYLGLDPPSAYSVPEVMIFNPIPVERVRISPVQPLLELELELAPNFDVITRIQAGRLAQQLTPWRTNYEAIHGPLEVPHSFKER